jgi:hypothetical protein
MPEQTDQPPIQGLTKEQEQLLADTIKQVQHQLYFRVLGQLRTTVLAVGGVLLLFGTFTLSGFRTAAVDGTVGILSKDDKLRANVLERMQIDTALANDRLRRALTRLDVIEDDIERLQNQTGRAFASLDPQLLTIQEMLDQLIGELRTKASSGDVR